ncbi:MAG: efflux RND transporter periplasmic adaptor subunit [Flavobacteriales bacterium]|nr:efflux RND transporter periplasmic adaptor subunit [Flavobacteriales bacterium]
MNNRRVLVILAVVAVILVIAAVVAKKKGLVGDAPATKVTTELAGLQSITETVSASGKIQSEEAVNISPDVAGEITALPVKEGDRVKVGQLLVKIDPDIQRSNVERLQASLNTSKANLANSQSRLTQAEARLTNSKAVFDRTQKLFSDKVVSQQDFDAARSEYDVATSEVEASRQGVEANRYTVKSAEAALREAEKQLTRTEIYSPVSGTVSKLSFRKGERVVGTSQMAGSEIMTISNLNEMEVQVDVNENDIIRVGLGDSCDVEVDAYLGEVFKGIVTSIANSAKSDAMGTDQVTNFAVKVRLLRDSYAHLENTKQPGVSPFRPGMSATVDIKTRTVVDALSVPVQAVTTRSEAEIEGKDVEKVVEPQEGEDDEEEAPDPAAEVTIAKDAVEVVFVLKDGKAVMRKVKTGIQNSKSIQIIEGLEKGEEIITAPYRAISKKLNNGDPVQVVTQDELFTATEEKE